MHNLYTFDLFLYSVTQGHYGCYPVISNGSAGGLDMLNPQHLKDLVQDVEIVEDSPFPNAVKRSCTHVCNLFC